MSKYVRIEGKPLIYKTTGTGRDTYIERSGFINFQPNQINLSSQTDYQGKIVNNKWNHSGKVGFRQTFQGTQTLKENAVVSYKTDGSGRDGYIYYNQGGIEKGTCNHKTYVQNYFKNSLRDYQKLPNRDEYLSTWNCQKSGFHYRNQKSNIQDNQNAICQSMLITRLSVPKKQQVKQPRIKDQKKKNTTRPHSVSLQNVTSQVNKQNNNQISQQQQTNNNYNDDIINKFNKQTMQTLQSQDLRNYHDIKKQQNMQKLYNEPRFRSLTTQNISSEFLRKPFQSFKTQSINVTNSNQFHNLQRSLSNNQGKQVVKSQTINDFYKVNNKQTLQQQKSLQFENQYNDQKQILVSKNNRPSTAITKQSASTYDQIRSYYDN